MLATITIQRAISPHKTGLGCVSNCSLAKIRRFVIRLPLPTLNSCEPELEGFFEMSVKSIVPHRHTIDDADDVIDYYREHAGVTVAESFAFEIDEAFTCLSKHPNIGSPRPEHDLDITGIKSWALKRFPHQIYYNVQDEHIELWRILHPRRDVTQAILSRKHFQ